MPTDSDLKAAVRGAFQSSPIGQITKGLSAVGEEADTLYTAAKKKAALGKAYLQSYVKPKPKPAKAPSK